MKKYLVVLLFFVVVSCSVDSDFGNSNWGDDIGKVTEMNSDKLDFKLSDDMLSYKGNIDGSNVSISYLFEGGKLISGFIIFDKLPVYDTKILYNSLLENTTSSTKPLFLKVIPLKWKLKFSNKLYGTIIQQYFP